MPNTGGLRRAPTLPSLRQAVDPALIAPRYPVRIVGKGRRRLGVPELGGDVGDRRTKLKKVGSERVSEVVKAESRQPRPGEVCTGAFSLSLSLFWS